jgi:hypothetical protein
VSSAPYAFAIATCRPAKKSDAFDLKRWQGSLSNRGATARGFGVDFGVPPGFLIWTKD